MGKSAIVFGASGIQGWAFVNTLLSDYPSKGVFDHVTAVTSRELPQERTLRPDTDVRLSVITGINLLDDSLHSVVEELKDAAGHIENITHVYYCAYKWSPDAVEEKRRNELMLRQCVLAMETLSANLEFIVLPTGTKSYGVHLLERFPYSGSLPLKETLPRLNEPDASKLFYYSQVDLMRKLTRGKTWTWCEIRPDVIVGFVPNNNAHCLAQTLGIYLSLYAHINGSGSSVSFPGTKASYEARFNAASQDIIAQFGIYASLNPNIAGGGRAFNVADTEPSSWSVIWPAICSYFNLMGLGPARNSPQPGAYIAEHRKDWDELMQAHGLREGYVDSMIINPEILRSLTTMFDFDRTISLEAMQRTGFPAKVVHVKDMWFTAFKRFQSARIIP
ncbi:hypothetical protein N7451_003105 [Penicillium sp. IBT 35674x]|nr:hypothetical protein N7451_003105 [Penicillium sp. IBT 35674x]